MHIIPDHKMVARLYEEVKVEHINSVWPLRTAISHSGIVFQKAQSHISMVLFVAYFLLVTLRAAKTFLPKDGFSAGL